MTTATSLPRSYVPSDHEPAIRARWDASGIFHATPEGDRPRYTILIPPPNVTAALHLGHAFNNTLQDVLARHQRMKGCETLWMPGTDHAGIATQAVVEKRLLAQGIRRRELGREAFVERVQAWKDEYEATITDQLKAMGASCDWARQRFTMDPICAEAVRTAFFRLFEQGLIVRGKRLVNWDPVTLTALADDEVEMPEVDGFFWYLKYPLVDDDGRDTGEYVTVATTRPETMLGDTAVAVNPSDADRARHVGHSVRLPIVDRIIPVIADDYVVKPDAESSDPKARYATGYLKVTPAHDPNDWEIGLRHDLPVINVMAPDASISDEHGWDDVSDEARRFLGQSRDEARAGIVAWFESHGLLADRKPYRHAVGHSYRSHVAIEPYLSDQWYVRVTDDRLVGEAQRALADDQRDGAVPARDAGSGDAHDGSLSFFPARYAKTYAAWHENLRDWCISRQLWWGHRIPVWSRDAEAGPSSLDRAALDEWLGAGRAAIGEDGPQGPRHVCVHDADDTEVVAALEGAGYHQDEDVLDTWFSSALWPLSTMGWPRGDERPETRGLLAAFNPTSVLCTAREIITLWVSRMVMFNRFFNDGAVPFRHVYVHAMIQDGHGQKMSKSLGNGVDPRDCIHSHGADALRFTMVQMATHTQDVRMPVDVICPHCDSAFHPQEITSPAGYRVAAPVQTCPGCKGKMVSGYGAATGTAEATDAIPLARNTSSRFDLGRNFANKLWNATRFALQKLENGPPPQPDLDLRDRPLIDRWIVSRFHHARVAVERALDDYQFNAYADAIYDFVWRDLCDWYLEAIKPTVGDDAGQQQVLRTVLNGALRLVHPVCPFVTEALWPAVREAGAAGVAGVTLPDHEILAAAAWPETDGGGDDDDRRFGPVQDVVNAIRNLRGERNVAPKRRVRLYAPAGLDEVLTDAGGIIETLAGLAAIERHDGDVASGAIPFTAAGVELGLGDLVDAVDVGAERKRLQKVVAEKRGACAGMQAKLANPGYVNNAPAAVVQQTRDLLAQAEAELAAAEHALGALR